MTPADRRLAALAAAFAPSSATSLLARCAGEGGAAVVAHAARLASAPRAERLRALAAALSPDSARPLAAADAASGERPRVAAVLRRVASGAAPAAETSPVLLRLCRERSAR